MNVQIRAIDELWKTWSDLNEILIRRSRSIVIPGNELKMIIGDTSLKDVSNNYSVIATLLVNIEQKYGVLLGTSAINELKQLSKKIIIDWYKLSLVPALDKITGNNHDMSTCMYPNFPEQLMDIDSAELCMNAFVHYASGGTLIRNYKKENRACNYVINALEDKTKSHTILNSSEDVMIEGLFKNLISSKISLGSQDIQDLKIIFSAFQLNCVQCLNNLCTEIPNKENLAHITKIVWDTCEYKCDMSARFKTATDVLRLYAVISNGDVSLSTPTRFINLNRKYRKLFMDLLNNCKSDIIEDMYRYKEMWLRVGEKLHPFTYNQTKYKKVIMAFDCLRNLHKPSFFNNKVETLLKVINNSPCDNDKIAIVNNLVSILQTRPGEFARRLDNLLSRHYNTNSASANVIILKGFKKVSKQVSIPVLFQLYSHFYSRLFGYKNPRVFLPKGNTAKFFVSDKQRYPIDIYVINNLLGIINDAIIYNLKKKPKLGKVYIDSDFEDYIVPFGLRSANPGSKTIIRGSKINIGSDINAIRLFIWWTNIDKPDNLHDSKVDLDLACGFYDVDWKLLYKTSYTNLVNKQINSYHSGDITDGGDPSGNGVAEFIDIDIDKALKYGCRYVAFMVNVFYGPTFDKIPCSFGWMKREAVNNKGEIFEPSTVNMKIDINSKSNMIVPAILDLETRRIIWTDMNISINKIKPVNIENNSKRVAQMIEAMMSYSSCRPTLYQLIYLNTIARTGKIVYKKEKADIIFSNDTSYEIKNSQKLITAYDADYYIGEMM